jgi:hypothetical protein
MSIEETIKEILAREATFKANLLNAVNGELVLLNHRIGNLEQLDSDSIEVERSKILNRVRAAMENGTDKASIELIKQKIRIGD